MRLLGFEINRVKKEEKALSQPFNRGGWLPIVRESFAGAWQRNITIDRDAVMSHFAVFACMTLIASDISKLRIDLEQRSSDDVWQAISSPAFSPVIRKPNDIQTQAQFWEHWMLSKLSNGNVYVLKQRDQRNVVVKLFILDPARVQVLVSDNGEVFYRLNDDDVSQLENAITVPASEIIHDRFNCFFHPLIGLSPLVAAGLAAMQGTNIQSQSTTFFGNRGLPSGILTAPGAISNESAQRIKEYWESSFTGINTGKIAVVGDGLTFDRLNITAVDSQLIEQLRFTAEMICAAFHVPPFKIGIGNLPSFNNVQALNIMYYQQALQCLIVQAETILKEGLSLPDDMRVNMNEEDLLRMDTVSMMDVIERSKNVLTLDERRKKFDVPPIDGGNTVYLQQQDHSIAAIAARDALLIQESENPQQPAPTIELPDDPPEPDINLSLTQLRFKTKAVA